RSPFVGIPATLAGNGTAHEPVTTGHARGVARQWSRRRHRQGGTAPEPAREAGLRRAAFSLDRRLRRVGDPGAGPRQPARPRRDPEKLAPPDTSVGDLIGDVDPIRVAEGRYLSDELTIHYGLIPRTNRGIVAINELPDLPERIQVGLFNILEERDVQIRGYQI